ncbi:hypothetical protein [Kitasatospora purpeofusca]|uniref:hypothetical protein n=1 Tax=Kitasatospora purpeofusca TaxID=67352 RepID=UPI0036D283F2
MSFVALHSAIGPPYRTVSLPPAIRLSAHTDAPRWTVAAVYAANSGVCVLLRSRIGSRAETARQGGRAFRLAGLFFPVSCPPMAPTADGPVWVAPGLAVLAVAVHSLGEVRESPGGYALGSGLAPDHAQGPYRGLGVGFDAGQAPAPVVLTTAVLRLGHTGRLLPGAFFAAPGAAGRRWPPGRSAPADRATTGPRPGHGAAQPGGPTGPRFPTPHS